MKCPCSDGDRNLGHEDIILPSLNGKSWVRSQGLTMLGWRGPTSLADYKSRISMDSFKRLWVNKVAGNRGWEWRITVYKLEK